MAKLSKKKVLKAIEGSGGILANIARKCEVSRTAMYKFLAKYPDVEQARLDEREEVLDMAENQLVKAVQRGEGWAVRYMLSTQRKDQYSYRREVTGAEGKELKGPAHIYQLGNGITIEF